MKQEITPIDYNKLNKLAEQVKEGFEDNLNDEELSKQIQIPVLQIQLLRSLMGLKYKKTSDVFGGKGKTLTKDKTNNRFRFNFYVPIGYIEKLGMDLEEDYVFLASVSNKKEITITIMRR